MNTLTTFFNTQHRLPVLACAIATTILGTEFSLNGQSAYAQSYNFICEGVENVTYDHPVTVNPRDNNINIEGKLSECEGEVLITSGSYNNRISSPGLSCAGLNSFPSEFTYFWKDDRGRLSDKSTVLYSYEVVTRTPTITEIESYGTVTSGKFRGDQVVKILTLPSIDSTRCLTTGISGKSGNVELSISGIEF